MLHFYKNRSAVIMLIFIANFCFSQPGQIRIKFMANCGLYITDGISNIYVDFPYKSGAHHYMRYDKSEIDSIKNNPVFIFTHKHSDHYSRKVKKLNGKRFGPWNVKKLEELSHSINDFSIQPFKTKHRFSFNHYSYLITWHNKKIFINGDTEYTDVVSKIANVDWAFLPAWIVRNAMENNIKIDAKMIGLYHIGPRDNITSTNPKIHLMNKQGDIISIPY